MYKQTQSSTEDWDEFGKVHSYFLRIYLSEIVPTPTATAPSETYIAPPIIPANIPYSIQESVERFRQGYIDAGGDLSLIDHFIYTVIPCEYGGRDFNWGWRPYVEENDYESRLQFDPGSWEKAGGGNPADDYQVGHNAAKWVKLIAVSGPGSTSGWPVCWW